MGRFGTPGQLLIALAVSLTQLVAWTAGLWGDGQPQYAARPELLIPLSDPPNQDRTTPQRARAPVPGRQEHAGA